MLMGACERQRLSGPARGKKLLAMLTSGRFGLRTMKAHMIHENRKPNESFSFIVKIIIIIIIDKKTLKIKNNNNNKN
jgi:hypothetical protein